jgi:NAD-dependent deacetylase
MDHGTARPGDQSEPAGRGAGRLSTMADDWFSVAEPTAVAEARRLIGRARAVTVLTGAGVSTDSGIPDFRGPQGLWTKNPKAEQTSNIEYYVRDREVRRLAWQGRMAWLDDPRLPNAGHRALVALDQRGVLHTLVTQNVDGLHQAAGTDPAKVVEVHGTVHETACLSCGVRGPIQATLDRVRAGDDDPACLGCGGLLKSATVSFGQSLDPGDLLRAEQAAEECDLLLAIGSTLSVFPIAAMVPMASRAGARIIIVNGQRTEMDDLADVVVRGSISDALVAILAPA